MQALVIRGGRPLAGTVRISGSKNAVLPMLAASVLFRRGCCIRQCPELTDVEAALEILRFLGAKVRRSADAVEVNPEKVRFRPIPPQLMNRMRGSVFFAGALLGRTGRCVLTQPGGCPLGARPVNFHLDGFRALGASEEPEGCFGGGLSGGSFRLPYPSVGATENLILAALGANGPTVLHGAAREPEIVCLCDFLRLGGCLIGGDGTPVVRIEPGLPDRAELAPIPDRMEAATFACALASAGGSIRLTHVRQEHLTAVLDALERAGCRIGREADSLSLSGGRLSSPGAIITGPYPDFPTDAQAPFLAAMLRAEGITTVKETVYSDRMKHISGLKALGADIECRNSLARVRGVEQLHAAAVQARDLRGGAALAVAALAAEGETRIEGVHHVMRGYEHFAEKLNALGAEAALT